MHKQHIIMNVQFSFSFYSSMSHSMKTCRLQDIDRAVSSCRQIKGGRKFPADAFLPVWDISLRWNCVKQRPAAMDKMRIVLLRDAPCRSKSNPSVHF